MTDETKPSDNPLIALGDVHLRLESRAGVVEILKGVTLNVLAGESVGIVGPSGSGKTSLLMIMAGLERATMGRVHVAGQNLSTAGEDQLSLLRGADMGIVFQSFHLVPTMTALENVALPLEFSGADNPFKRAAEALETVGLDHRLQHFPAQLSGGEQQRVALARAIANRPRMIFADEPTGNLDAASGAIVVDQLFDLHVQRLTTLVLITHDQELAARCSRVVEIRDGVIAAERKTGLAA